MKDELVSIIIPIFNAEKYLKRCIDSIIKQTYKNIEIILVNDGSTDGSMKLIESYSDTRIIIINKINTGVSDSRNIGLDNAKGKYVTFVDSDDWLADNAIEKMYEFISENNYNVIRTNYIKANDNFEEKNCIFYKNNDEKTDIYNEIELFLSGKIPCFVWLLMIDRVWLNNKKIRFDSNIKVREDTIFYLKILQEKEIIQFLNYYTYYYFINPSSVMHSKDIIRIVSNILDSNEIILSILKRDNKLIEISNIGLANIVIGYLYNAYILNFMKFKEYYYWMKKNKKIEELLNKTIEKNYNGYSNKITYILYKENKFYLLQLFYYFKNFLRKIKTKIVKRVEE